MQNLVLRAYIIYVMGVYIIFETLHTFSTCYTMYQDMHVNSLIVSPGSFFLLIVAMLLTKPLQYVTSDQTQSIFYYWHWKTMNNLK